MNGYFRWTFEEVWKFRMPYPQEYTYAYINDTTFNFESMPVIKTECWKENRSGDIITSSILTGKENYINKQEIQFIAPVKTDRLTKQYSILVKQYSVSEKEYDFWRNLKKAGEAGGDIFASQPYPVISNIRNVNSPGEMVLGYFEVSAVTSERIFITSHELDSLNLPHYKTNCFEIAKSPDDFGASLVTWSDIYHMYTDKGEYAFIGPDVKPGTIIAGHVYTRSLLEFIFSPTVCAVCESSGFANKPDFWIDLE